MADLNNVSFTGRLTKDAVKKVLPTGTGLVTFSLANNTGWGDYAKVLYLECNLWGKQGESLLKYLLKGKQVAVSGTLELQKWTSAQDGTEKQKNVINCRDVILLSSAASQEEHKGPPGGLFDGPVVDAPKQADDDFAEDIPF